MRRGRVVERIELMTEGVGARPPKGSPDPLDADASSILSAAVQQFYGDRDAPPEVHLPVALGADDTEAIEAWLLDRGRRVRLVVPQRGDKRGLVDLAMRNAAMAYQSHFNDAGTTSFEALDTLRALLGLPALPRRIECFDISTLQGRETVASMVVAVEGRMQRGQYRKFRIRGTTEGITKEPPSAQAAPQIILDDFKSMHEVVVRRYRKLLEQGGPFPDLIVIDGGKGQLTAAYDALRCVGLERLVAIGLAKQEELIFTRDREDGIALPRDSAALHLLQRIRDEAHRFAVTFNRARRKKTDLHSALDDVPGVGAAKRKLLLTKFGSVAGVRRASREELEAAVGAKTAEAIVKHFG
jgi:excinuclease ABC subunit C